MRHAQPVLAVQQYRQEAGQVHVEDVAHAVVDRLLVGQVRHRGVFLPVRGVPVAGQVELCDQPRFEQRERGFEPLPGQRGHPGEPRERVRAGQGRLVEPGVAAEQLVGRLAGQRHGRALAHRLEQQVQRRQRVAHDGRQVVRAERAGAVQRVHQVRGVQHDVRVIGADQLGDVVHERRVRRTDERVGTEVLGPPGEVHRERPDRAAATRPQRVRNRRNPAGAERTRRSDEIIERFRLLSLAAPPSSCLSTAPPEVTRLPFRPACPGVLTCT
nr:hypothetical protein [Actinoplanes subtropicus]